MPLFQVVLQQLGGDESRFGDYGRSDSLPQLNGQDLIAGATIIVGGREWLVADASTDALTKFVCTPITSTRRAF